MTTCATLSREYCMACDSTTLHDSGACMHCGTNRYIRHDARPRIAKDFVDEVFPERHRKPTPAHINRRPTRVPSPGTRHKQKRPTDIVRGKR